MAKTRIFVDRNVANGNLWNAATAALTGSSAASALPWTNTQNPERLTVGRSATGTGEAYLDIDLGAGYASYPVTAIGVANVKLLGTGVLKLQELGVAAAPGAATDVVTLPTQHTYRKIAYAYPAAAVTKRHYRLLFTNPTAVSDYAELGFVFLGSYFEPGVNWSAPADFAYQDPSQIRASDGGQESLRQRTPYYEAGLEFRDLSQSDFDAMHAIYDLVQGIGTPFFLVLDADQGWQNALVRFTSGIHPNRGRAYGRTSFLCSYKEWL